MGLKAYQVGCSDGCEDRQYCNLVFAHNPNEARRISGCDDGVVGYMGLRATRFPKVDGMLKEGETKAYHVTEPAILRAAGWQVEGELPCGECGLCAMGMEEYSVCEKCGRCRECGCNAQPHEKALISIPPEGVGA